MIMFSRRTFAIYSSPFCNFPQLREAYAFYAGALVRAWIA